MCGERQAKKRECVAVFREKLVYCQIEFVLKPDIEVKSWLLFAGKTDSKLLLNKYRCKNLAYSGMFKKKNVICKVFG